MYSEEEIISGLKARSQSVFNYLYGQNMKKAYSIIGKFNGTEEDAKEMFHDALLTLAENVIQNKFKGNSSIDTYLISITKLKWLRELKKRKVKYVELAEDVKDVPFTLPEESEGKSSHLLKTLNEHLHKIDDSCRKLLIGFYYEQKKLESLANELNYTPQFVRVKKSRCLNKMKTLLQK